MQLALAWRRLCQKVGLDGLQEGLAGHAHNIAGAELGIRSAQHSCVGGYERRQYPCCKQREAPAAACVGWAAGKQCL